jgi:squalene-hopene/tetraprenyl-beta-curcumene cyclase
LDFLEASARDDGSWPIDTNLATWVSTQAVNAFAAGGAIEDLGERGEATRGWLLSQQHVNRHPYTGSRPGGWAWTDLSGGVPDADDTASVSLSLHALAPGHADVREAALAGTDWLLDLQNADGGMPTFCRGWGRLEFDRSAVDLTAHALRAWKTWRQDATPAMQRRIDRATRKGLHFIKANQSADGSFTPLWFGNQAHPNELNPTYGTARALLALAERTDAEQVAAMTSRAAAWLLDAQHEDGGWGGASGLPASIEETAVAVEALAALRQKQRMDWGMDAIHSAIAHGSDWLCEHTMRGTEFPSAPIGLYFARLWYAEQLYPAIFTAAALGRSLRLSTGGSAQTAAR